tara:strand:+ start:321 stop:773 length:453 start_codon:yes stop_codon:yes gene_type:complete
MPKVIFQNEETSVYLFTNIDEPNHSSKAMIRAALREYITRQPLDSCIEPITVHWNKSDSHTYCVIACSQKRVGVDIEYMRERSYEKLSKRWFDPIEVTDDMEIFYDIWCQKEAYTKWKKERLAKNIRKVVDKPMTPLKDLPDNVVGYLCI